MASVPVGCSFGTQVRFKSKAIYTYVGEILVVTNPFEFYPDLYSPAKMTQYRGIGNKNSLPP